MLVLMGVSGSGKSTIGRMLAEGAGWSFFDADDYHGAANIDKMAHGIPLGDADRMPWLDTLRREVVEPSLSAGTRAVLACSALKAAYLERLGARDPRVAVVCLKGDSALIAARLARRGGHFMDPGLLASQYADLEVPSQALIVDVAKAPQLIVDEIIAWLGLPAAAPRSSGV